MLGISMDHVYPCSIQKYCSFLLCLLLFDQMYCSLALLLFMTSHCVLFLPLLVLSSLFFASTVLAHANMCLLMTSFVFLNAVSSHINSVNILSPFMVLGNLFFKHFSFSLYPPSFAFIVKWPNHSLANSFCFLGNLQYCKDDIVLVF